MSKYDKIAELIPKIAKLDKKGLSSVEKVVNACSLIQIISDIDVSEIKDSLNKLYCEEI